MEAKSSMRKNYGRKLSPDSVRRRKPESQKFFPDVPTCETEDAAADDHSETATKHDRLDSPTQPVLEWRSVEEGTFWLTRIVILRYIGFIYCKFKREIYDLVRVTLAN